MQPVRWTGPYRILQKLSPVLYVLDFHNTQKKIHITHLKMASNLSINRRKLEICRQNERSQDKPVNKEPVISTTIDEIWSEHHNDHI